MVRCASSWPLAWLTHGRTRAWQVKKAYHTRAKEWHPDKNRGEAKREEKAERNFKLIARAYEVLGDKETRAAYDRGENVDDPKWRPREAWT